MALLDDLQSQVADIKAAELSLREEQQEQEEFYALSLRPVMVQARDYFDAIVQNICIIDPKIEHTYPIDPQQATGVTFKQSEYEFNYNDSRNPRQLDIRCTCRLKSSAEFYVSTKEGVENYSRLLRDYGLPFHQKNQLDEFHNIRGATFILDEALPAQIRILSHPADRCIYVDFRNLEEEPQTRYRFDPGQMTMEVFERIAQVLLRQEKKLIRVDVSDDYRGELQKKLEIDRLNKEKNVAEGLAYLEAERQAEKDARLINRTKNALSTGTLKVVAAISSASNDRNSKFE